MHSPCSEGPFAAFASRDPATLPSDGDEEDLDEREVAAAAAIAPRCEPAAAAVNSEGEDRVRGCAARGFGDSIFLKRFCYKLQKCS